MFISRVFVFFFALLISSAIAAPVIKERSPDEPQLSARTIKHMSQAVGIAMRIKKSLRPQPGQAVFWSGTKSGKNGPVSVGKDAEKFAKVNGKEVLRHALAKQGIKIPPPSQNPHSSRLWEIASKVYALRASGDTHAILGSVRRPGNVYDAIERPTLLKNEKVPKLTEHNAETGKSTVVKE